MTTFSSFLQAMQNIAISGVNPLRSVPNTIRPDQLPCSFPMFPEASFVPRYADQTGLSNFTGDLVVLFAKAEQGTPEADYTRLQELVDATHSALFSAYSTFGGVTNWSIGTRLNFAVGTSGDYHAIVATVNTEA